VGDITDLPQRAPHSRSLERDGRNMEQFVRTLVAGGVVLVTGLWIVTLVDRGTPPWTLGAAMSLLGAVALGVGIESQIEY
jgi:hypothetical protein